jgi:octaprenyl-diphosphate synthase
MNDFVEGKCTLPYIYLYHQLSQTDQHKLASFHKQELSVQEIEWIKNLMHKHHSIEASFKLAQELSNEAKNIMSDEKELCDILDTMIKRSY